MPKKAPKDAKVSTAEIETFEGKKKLTVWEYSTPVMFGVNISLKSYMDLSKGIMYKHESTLMGTTTVQTLKSYEPVWQKSFEESESVGITYEYSAAFEGLTFNVDIVCVAGCTDGKFGVKYDFTSLFNPEVYYLSDHPQGLPVGAKYTGAERHIDTIDGENKKVQVWNMLNASEQGLVFYYDAESHVVYRFVAVGGTEIVFNLTKKPQ